MMTPRSLLSATDPGRLASRGRQDTDGQRGRDEYEAILVYSGSNR